VAAWRELLKLQQLAGNAWISALGRADSSSFQTTPSWLFTSPLPFSIKSSQAAHTVRTLPN
jgi:hypothetical protein